MDLKDFQSLMRYYLSCMDAEEAAQLKLRKNQEFKTHIFIEHEKEELFADDLPQLEIPVLDQKGIQFIERKAASTETLIDLYYGFPSLVDDRDMISPLFFMEMEANFTENTTLCLLPKIKRFSVNRMHFIAHYGAEETQRICEELEGEFGSFEARLRAADSYIPSLKKDNKNWINKPILFRSNASNSRSQLRYDLTQLLKEKDVLSIDTALKFLLQNTHKEDLTRSKHCDVLEIGALNAQQEEAVTIGLQHSLSVITGPPGTGKTQVVTALLASAVFNNQTVLFASNNNMPVDGVYERLGQYTGDASNWLMRLGNQEKRETCFKTISSLLENVDIVDFSKEELDKDYELFTQKESDISHTQAQLKKAAILEEKISKLYTRELEITQKLPKEWTSYFSEIDPVLLDDRVIQKLKSHSAKGLSLWLRRKLFSLDSFKNKQNKLVEEVLSKFEALSHLSELNLIEENWEEAVKNARKAVHYISLHQYWAKLVTRCRQLEAQVTLYPSTIDLGKLKKEKSIISQSLFGKKWLENIHRYSNQAKEALNTYIKDIDDYSMGRHTRLEASLVALKRFFPIWITTNQSAGAIMPPSPALFDLLVIDEAGQCDIPSVLPLLYRAKRAVIIGDPEQFKHIATLNSDIEEAIAKSAKVLDKLNQWSYTSRSIFDRAFAVAHSASFLKQHYRCHPDVIEFSNQSFYDGKLVTQTSLSQFDNQLPIKESGLIWHNVAGQAIRAQKGAWNSVEINQTIDIFDQWSRQGLFASEDITYGVITPFRKQVEEMKKAFKRMPWFEAVEDRFTIGTAHSFQGSECDVLVYSPVVATNMDEYLIKFAATQRDLINVTVTRAKNLLYIIGDLHACQKVPSDTPLFKLAAYAEKLRVNQKQPMNKAEKAMANILDELNLSYVPQQALGPYRLDFIVNTSSGDRYDLEVDGDIHLTAQSVQHDDRRDAYVANQGLKIVRFSARDIMNKSEVIKERLIRL